jgi:hypothetical protein
LLPAELGLKHSLFSDLDVLVVLSPLLECKPWVGIATKEQAIARASEENSNALPKLWVVLQNGHLMTANVSIQSSLR